MRKPPPPKTPGFVEDVGQYCPTYTEKKTVFGITNPEKCAAICRREKGCNAFSVPSNRDPESYFKYVKKGLKDDMSCGLYYNCKTTPMTAEVKNREVTFYSFQITSLLCSNNKDCPKGFMCPGKNGKCRPSKCSSDSDCVSNYKCGASCYKCKCSSYSHSTKTYSGCTDNLSLKKSYGPGWCQVKNGAVTSITQGGCPNSPSETSY
jgi:hypothetical protein